MSTTFPVSVVCTPGFETVTRDEMIRLGVTIDEAKPAEREPGLIFAQADARAIYAMNLHLRTASRVRVNHETFLAAAFSELRKKARRIPWALYLNPGEPISVKVTTHASALYHKKGIAERIAGAVTDALGKETKLAVANEDDDAAGTAPIVFVRLVRNVCSISIDTSGDHLHRRGYRLDIAKAPLRENLAASLLLAADWPGDVPMVDPFCGSGTLCIEAAMIAAGIPPGTGRTFACSRWPSFDPAIWAEVLAAVPPRRTDGLPVIAGFDRDAGAIAASKANAVRAGVGDLIRFDKGSISDLVLPEQPGWIVTNPPYGERVKGGPDLRNLYARMGSVWREAGALWHIYMVTSSPRWTGQLGLPVKPVTSFLNGGIPVKLYQVDASVPKL